MNDVLLFLQSPDNRIFISAFVVTVVILILDIVAMVMGASLHFDKDISIDKPAFDKPNFDKPDISKGDIDKPGFAYDAFAWINAGKVPLLILLIAFLGAFSVTGLTIQWIVKGFLGNTITPLIVGPIALVLTLPIVRWVSKVVAKILPQDETAAVGLDSLTGATGPLVMGPATKDNPGQARIRDSFGTDHYIRVVPEGDDPLVTNCTVVLLDRRASDIFTARQI